MRSQNSREERRLEDIKISTTTCLKQFYIFSVEKRHKITFVKANEIARCARLKEFNTSCIGKGNKLKPKRKYALIFQSSKKKKMKCSFVSVRFERVILDRLKITESNRNVYEIKRLLCKCFGVTVNAPFLFFSPLSFLVLTCDAVGESLRFCMNRSPLP